MYMYVIYVLLLDTSEVKKMGKVSPCFGRYWLHGWSALDPHMSKSSGTLRVHWFRLGQLSWIMFESYPFW